MNFSKITARKLAPSDYWFVYNLTRRSMLGLVNTYSKWDKKIFDRDYPTQSRRIKILYCGKRRVGFYLIENRPDHLFVSKMYIIDSYKNKGIGSYLMGKIERGTQKKRVVLDVWENNRAIKFYEKLGYKRTGKDGHLIVMEKALH